MKAIANTLIAAIIVVNTWVGNTDIYTSSFSKTSDDLSKYNELPLSTKVDDRPENNLTVFPSSLSEPLQCSRSSEASYYLGPVLPETTSLVVPKGTLTGADGGFKGVITTDYYVGAIFKYSVDPDFDGLEGPGDVEAFRGQYENNETSEQLFYLTITDALGAENSVDSGSFCSSNNPLDNKSSMEICNLVCPSCQINVNPAGIDGGAKRCNRPTSECVDSGIEIHGGFHLYVTRAERAQIPISAKFYDIQLIYYGIPKHLPPRSKLSDNKPKNSSGDSRDCDVSRCDDNRTSTGDPIDVLTGNFDYSYTDLSLQTIAGVLSLQRSYASQAIDTNIHPTDISPGWTHNQDIRLLFEEDIVWFKGHTLNQYRFDVIGDHEYDPYNGVLTKLVYIDEQYILTTSSQSVYVFDNDGRLITWNNERGYGFNYIYSGGKLEKVTEPVSGRFLHFNYIDSKLQSVTDNAGRQVSYGYNSANDLVSVTDVRGNTWGYAYDGEHRITNVYAPGNPPEILLITAYDEQGRANEQHDGAGNQLTHIDFNPDGSSTSIDANGVPTNYTPDCRGVITRTENSSVGHFPGYFIDRGYDHNFNLTSIRGEDDETATQFRWSTDGVDLLEMTDQAGNSTSFTYDTNHHLTRVESPENQWQTFNYTGPLLESSTENSSHGDITTTYAYTTIEDAPQPIHLLKSITDALNNQTSFVYDPLGQLIAITDAEYNQTHFTYDATGQVTTITDALGRSTLVEYDPSGSITHIVENYVPDPQPDVGAQYNLSTTYIYDRQGRLETVKDTNDLIIATTKYNNAGRIYQLLDALNNATTYFYNEDGSVDTVLIAPDYLIHYDYDELGRVREIRNSSNHLVTAYTYNTDDTVSTTTDGAGLVTSYTYDSLHRVISVSDNLEGDIERVTSTTYDAYGEVTSVTDALGRVTHYEYDDPGQLSAVVENYIATPPPGYDINATNIRTEYTYDKIGNLKNILDATGHSTYYSYTDLYQLESITDPLNHITSYSYDEIGNQKTLTRPDGTITEFEYDLVNRLIGIDYPGGDVYDVDFTYNELSQLTDMEDSLGHTSWVYNPLGQPESITDPFLHTVAYQYDTLGNRSQLTYPGDRTINYQYYTDGLLKEVYDGADPVVTYAYDSADRLQSVTYANGVVTSYDYDISSQLIGINHRLNSRNLAAYAYTYDLLGNLVQTKETNRYPNYGFLPTIDKDAEFIDSIDNGYPAPENISISPDYFWYKFVNFFDSLFSPLTVSAREIDSNPVPDQVINYTYDALNRLKSASFSSGTSYFYNYDKEGNRTSQLLNGDVTTYVYDITNRLTSVNGMNYQWNDNGSLINDGLMNYVYNPAGQLSEINNTAINYNFQYDGLGNRYNQIAGGLASNYTLDLAAGLTQVLREGTTTYLYGLGMIGQETSGKLEITLADRMGSVRQLVTEDQQVTLLKSYDPFGNLLLNQGDGESSFGYTGQQMDKSGLEYLRARYYDPETGRFISADPFPGILSMPATQNAYPYVINNPLNFTDPSGEILPFLVAGVAGGLIGGGMSMVEQCIGSGNVQTCMKCMDWGKVGVATAAGTVAGVVGFGVGLIGGALGAGIIPTIATGFVTGIVTGQVFRATDLVLSGDWDQAGSVLFQSEDIVLDGFLGVASSAVGYGVGSLFKSLSGCSFSEDTTITVEDGEKTISDIEVGVKVLGWDQETDSVDYYPVTAIIVEVHQVIINLIIDGEWLKTTPEHPFFTEEYGWLPASELFKGLHIVNSNNKYGLIELSWETHESHPMYNLTIATAHTYFVGNGQWLVHNTCKIFGHVQSNASNAHNKMMQIKAQELLLSGEYEAIWMDKNVSIASKYNVYSGSEPDVVGYNYTLKKAHIIEIASKTQVTKNGFFSNDFQKQLITLERAFRKYGWKYILEVITHYD